MSPPDFYELSFVDFDTILEFISRTIFNDGRKATLKKPKKMFSKKKQKQKEDIQFLS